MSQPTDLSANTSGCSSIPAEAPSSRPIGRYVPVQDSGDEQKLIAVIGMRTQGGIPRPVYALFESAHYYPWAGQDNKASGFCRLEGAIHGGQASNHNSSEISLV